MPGSEIRGLPIVQAFQQYLGDDLVIDRLPIARGRILLTTISQEGWTLRVSAGGTRYGSISLMWNQNIGKGIIRIPSSAHLIKYLPKDAAGIISQFRDEIWRLGFDIDGIPKRQSVGVSENEIVQAMPRLRPIILALASAYSVNTEHRGPVAPEQEAN